MAHRLDNKQENYRINNEMGDRSKENGKQARLNNECD
jgi:hypothetical protein